MARFGFPAASRTSTSPDGRLRGLATSSGYIAADAGDSRHRPQRPRHVRHAAPPRRADRGQAVPARRADRAAPGADRSARGTAPSAGHPALGAAEYSASVRAGESRPLHLLHVRRRLRDAQRQRARLFLHQRHEREPPRFSVRQQRAGRHHRSGRDRQHSSAGGRPLPAACRAPRLPGGGSIVRGAASVGP